MGAGSSSPVPLEVLTKDEIAAAISGLGPKYEPYAHAVSDNAIDGDILASFDEQDLLDTFEELGISSKLHRRVLTKHLDKAKKCSSVSSPTKITITPETPKLTDVCESQELENYSEISEKILESLGPNTIYAGVNLHSKDELHCLSSSFHLKDGKMQTYCGHEMPLRDSLCNHLVASPEDSVVFQVPGDFPLHAPNGDEYSGPHKYVGRRLKVNDERVGTVCMVESEHGTTEDEKEQDRIRLLEDFAVVAESLLEESKALRYRNDKLKSQIERSKAVEDVDSEESPQFGMPESPRTNSASDQPVFRQGLAETEEEIAHLPPTFFKELDKIGLPHPPIRKDDMVRVAAVESLGLMNIDPGDPVARSLNNIVSMTARMFDYQMAQLAIHNQDTEFVICRYLAQRTSDEEVAYISSFFTTLKSSCCAPFLLSKGRNNSICNFPIHSKKTFVVNDTLNDPGFAWYKDVFRAYVGSPILNMDGHVVANLCLFDLRDAKHFDKDDEAQIEQIALTIAQIIENWALRREMEQLEQERRRSIDSRRDRSGKTAPPQGEAAIVLTDVQGSTSLWEANPSAMQEALKVHDDIMRKCYKQHYGYEITTEGDAFLLAFHDPVDAIHFALKAQACLHEADWPDDILKQPDAADDGHSFRGLRVRMGIHCGQVTSEENEVTGRMEYKGATWHVAKNVEAMCHGGQILATIDAWRVASWESESLGSPQVVDLGEYVLSTGKALHEGIISKRVVQLVPNNLAFDYFSARQYGTESKKQLVEDDSTVSSVSAGNKNHTLSGRTFAPPLSKRQLRASFYDAPHVDGKVTVTFVYMSEVKDNVEDSDSVLAALSKFFSSLLVDFDGYECKTGMFVFPNPSSAVGFGLKAIQELESKSLEGQSNLGRLLKVGVHSGVFTSMGPNPTTGRADYYGQVVNRAARVAGASGAGKVYVGVTTSDDEETPGPPELGSSIETRLEGVKMLKGVTKAMALYSCSQS